MFYEYYHSTVDACVDLLTWKETFFFLPSGTCPFTISTMHSMNTDIFKMIFYNRLLVIDKCYKLNLDFRNKVFVGVVGVQLSISLLCLFAFKKIIIQKKFLIPPPKVKFINPAPEYPFPSPVLLWFLSVWFLSLHPSSVVWDFLSWATRGADLGSARMLGPSQDNSGRGRSLSRINKEKPHVNFTSSLPQTFDSVFKTL